MWLAQILLQKDDIAGAYKEIDVEIEQYPENPDSYCLRAIIQFKQEQVTRNSLCELLDPNVSFILSFCQYKEAVKSCQEGIALVEKLNLPKDHLVNLYFERSKAHAFLGTTQEFHNLPLISLTHHKQRQLCCCE